MIWIQIKWNEKEVLNYFFTHPTFPTSILFHFKLKLDDDLSKCLFMR